MDVRIYLCLLLSVLVESQKLLTVESCGLSEVSSVGDRIVGGRDAKRNEYPWQVSLRFKSFFISPIHLCGASILNEWWIITAAHCVYRRYARNFDVVVGINSQNERNFVKYLVDQIQIHAGFEPATYLHDIALIRLNRPIFMNSGVNGVCLPPLEQDVTGDATAAGWGATREDGSMSSMLQTVEVPIISSSKCKALFGSENFFPTEMLCAGYLEGGIDSCQGDSGGPLVQVQDGRAVLIGIVSWGIGCARPNLPGVYTRVSHYIDWIINHTM